MRFIIIFEKRKHLRNSYPMATQTDLGIAQNTDGRRSTTEARPRLKQMTDGVPATDKSKGQLIGTCARRQKRVEKRMPFIKLILIDLFFSFFFFIVVRCAAMPLERCGGDLRLQSRAVEEEAFAVVVAWADPRLHTPETTHVPAKDTGERSQASPHQPHGICCASQGRPIPYLLRCYDVDVPPIIRYHVFTSLVRGCMQLSPKWSSGTMGKGERDAYIATADFILYFISKHCVGLILHH